VALHLELLTRFHDVHQDSDNYVLKKTFSLAGLSLGRVVRLSCSLSAIIKERDTKYTCK